jgi:hypothetical protein
LQRCIYIIWFWLRPWLQVRLRLIHYYNTWHVKILGLIICSIFLHLYLEFHAGKLSFAIYCTVHTVFCTTIYVNLSWRSRKTHDSKYKLTFCSEWWLVELVPLDRLWRQMWSGQTKTTKVSTVHMVGVISVISFRENKNMITCYQIKSSYLISYK